MSLQLTSGSGERTCDEAALWLNEEPENLTLLSYSYCIMGTLKPADIPGRQGYPGNTVSTVIIVTGGASG